MGDYFMYHEMQRRLKYLEKQISQLQKEIKAFPVGEICIYNNNGSQRWYLKMPNEKRVYLSQKDRKRAEKLAAKAIAENRLMYLKKELYATKLYLSHAISEEDLLRTIKNAGMYYKIVPPKYYPYDEIEKEWMNAKFESNPYFPEKLTHESASGHFLRSKSEALIDTELFYRGIPFRYECRLDIGRQVVYPDFTFYKASTDEYRYWEHCGMMDDKKYRTSVFEKMGFYTANGYYPDRDIYYSFENLDEGTSYKRIRGIISDIEDWLDR